MIAEVNFSKVLKRALRHGGEFAELFLEKTSALSIICEDNRIERIIVGTELGLLHRLQKENPGKKFIPVCEQAVCPNMKLISLDDVLWSLEEMQHVIRVPEDVRKKAEAAVRRMINIV